MAQRFKVTPRTMRSTADELETLNNKFKNEVSRLRTDNQTLGRQWQGEARDKFNQEFLKDAEKFDRFYDGIQKFIQQLRKNADEYDKVENLNKSIAAVRKA
ncbi:MAG: WXG100 family type VII secretion target [Lachnospiraceae bacterium]|nr:WXG100 family type VII secretion target [Lachnospiraceae bacterium]